MSPQSQTQTQTPLLCQPTSNQTDNHITSPSSTTLNERIQVLINERKSARFSKNYKLADELGERLKELNVLVSDRFNGDTFWEFDAPNRNDSGIVVAESLDVRKEVKAVKLSPFKNQKNRDKNNRKKRSSSFALWVTQKFARILPPTTHPSHNHPPSVSAPYPVIVDVAGGNGSTMYEFAVTHGLNCVVVDVFGVKLSESKSKSVMRLGYYSDVIDDADGGRGGVRECECGIYDHDDDLLTSLNSLNTNEPPPQRYQCAHPKSTWLSTSQRNLYPTPRTSHTLRYLDRIGCSQILGLLPPLLLSDSTNNSNNDSDDEVKQVNFKIYEAIQSCSMITGLHPDEATELIVDYALKYNKPFAIVPCCVFPNLNPDRYYTSTSLNACTGESESVRLSVRTREEFCMYLKGKCGGIEVEVVNEIPGPCNTVVYWFGE